MLVLATSFPFTQILRRAICIAQVRQRYRHPRHCQRGLDGGSDLPHGSWSMGGHPSRMISALHISGTTSTAVNEGGPTAMNTRLMICTGKTVDSYMLGKMADARMLTTQSLTDEISFQSRRPLRKAQSPDWARPMERTVPIQMSSSAE